MVCERDGLRAAVRAAGGASPREPRARRASSSATATRVALDGVDFDGARRASASRCSGPTARASRRWSRSPRAAAAGRGMVSVRGRPGLAPQEIGIYPSLTVRENLWAFARAPRRVAPARGAAARAVRADRAGRPARGAAERRRAAAAAHGDRGRAPAARGAARRADRGRGHADAVAAILRAVLDLAGDGAAVVYTTHYLPEVEELDAGVALLEAGRIIATGAVSELVAQHAESVRRDHVHRRAGGAPAGHVAARPGRRRDPRRSHPVVAGGARTWR